MELQAREMGRIQAAISEQLRDVAARQASLEALNDKLRERPEAARQRLLGTQFQLTQHRLEQLKNIRCVWILTRVPIFFTFFLTNASHDPYRKFGFTIFFGNRYRVTTDPNIDLFSLCSGTCVCENKRLAVLTFFSIKYLICNFSQ
jgi:hypothetical protein